MFGRKLKVDTQIDALEKLCQMQASDLNAIKDNMGYIEFTPNGEVIDVNDLFLAVIGYSRAEIQGKHHRLFCERDYASSQEYQSFGKICVPGAPSAEPLNV